MANFQPGAHVDTRGDAPAVIMANSGEVVTYRELDERSKRVAQLLSAAGLRPGDHIGDHDGEPSSVLRDLLGGPARRALHDADQLAPQGRRGRLHHRGLRRDRRVRLAPLWQGWPTSSSGYLGNVTVRLMVDGTVDGYESYEDAIAKYPAEPLADEIEGTFMFYSSGTTGSPEGHQAGDRPAAVRRGRRCR